MNGSLKAVSVLMNRSGDVLAFTCGLGHFIFQASKASLTNFSDVPACQWQVVQGKRQSCLIALQQEQTRFPSVGPQSLAMDWILQCVNVTIVPNQSSNKQEVSVSG